MGKKGSFCALGTLDRKTSEALPEVYQRPPRSLRLFCTFPAAAAGAMWRTALEWDTQAHCSLFSCPLSVNRRGHRDLPPGTVQKPCILPAVSMSTYATLPFSSQTHAENPLSSHADSIPLQRWKEMRDLLVGKTIP
jgi:hypothetical protein